LLARFQREAKVVAGLRHPNIARSMIWTPMRGRRGDHCD
jgi:hypothetical protein